MKMTSQKLQCLLWMQFYLMGNGVGLLTRRIMHVRTGILSGARMTWIMNKWWICGEWGRDFPATKLFIWKRLSWVWMVFKNNYVQMFLSFHTRERSSVLYLSWPLKFTRPIIQSRTSQTCLNTCRMISWGLKSLKWAKSWLRPEDSQMRKTPKTLNT